MNMCTVTGISEELAVSIFREVFLNFPEYGGSKLHQNVTNYEMTCHIMEDFK
jgi:hypothetical protein